MWNNFSDFDRSKNAFFRLYVIVSRIRLKNGVDKIEELEDCDFMRFYEIV